jgi:hypothetical protein
MAERSEKEAGKGLDFVILVIPYYDMIFSGTHLR